MKVIAYIIIGLLAWLHWTFSSPWLISHGSSLAFDTAMSLWLILLLMFCYCSLTLPWNGIIKKKEKKNEQRS